MNTIDDNRGVRNVFGFVLAFSIVLLSVGIVATVGQNQIAEMSQTERLNNAENAMELIDTSLQQLQQQRAEVRSNEIDLASGSLAVTNGSTMTIQATGPDTDFRKTVSVGSLQYRFERTTITYQTGALFRTLGENPPALVSPPTMTCSNDVAMVSLIVIRANSTRTISGEFATVTGRARTHDLLFPVNRTGAGSARDATKLNVTVSSFADGWGQYFTETGNWTRSADNEHSFVCTDVDAVYVHRSIVSVDLAV